MTERIPNRIRAMLTVFMADLLNTLRDDVSAKKYRALEIIIGELEDKCCKLCDRCEKEMKNMPKSPRVIKLSGKQLDDLADLIRRS